MFCDDLEERTIKSAWIGAKSGLEKVFQGNKQGNDIPESRKSISKSVEASEWACAEVFRVLYAETR